MAWHDKNFTGASTELRTWRESGEGEHADLLRDVLPAARGP